MKHTIAALALFAALPAHAEVFGSGFARMRLVPPEPPCIAMVEVVNKHGTYNAVETLQTPAGPVSIRYETVGGHNPEDHDLVEVVDMPPGVMAAPPYMELPDGDTGYICFLEWEGM